MDRDAVRVDEESAGDVRGALRRLNFRAAVGGPVGAVGRDREFLFADLLAADEDFECAFIGDERCDQGLRSRRQHAGFGYGVERQKPRSDHSERDG